MDDASGTAVRELRGMPVPHAGGSPAGTGARCCPPHAGPVLVDVVAAPGRDGSAEAAARGTSGPAAGPVDTRGRVRCVQRWQDR
ncbi:hypothetical protein [Streptomyces sp. NPDC001380]|uniref:hypothetical protein n=1 Tax=Streptomyces sp. NPDC001380 TaxID=3364566 RepID=UPI0036A251A3